MALRETLVKRDYYEILGVDRDADESAIKKAYRRLAVRYHPDRNPGDKQAAERMKEINEAYAVLSDPEKRKLYDAYGHAGLRGYTAEDIFGGIDFGSIFRELGLRDIFSDFGFGSFGFAGSIFDDLLGHRARVRELKARKGSDLQYDLEIELEEAFAGGEKTINLLKKETCPMCQGRRASKEDIATCKQCKGTGQIVKEQRSGYSIFRQITTCTRCQGEGTVIVSPCRECRGKGSVEILKEIKVELPRGVDTDDVIKVQGEGEPGRDGGQPGDLYVRLRVKEHPIFERRGSDIYVRKEITITQALLGGKVDGVPGLSGSLGIEIPEGTEDGTIFRVEGQGMPKLGGRERGDEYVIVKIAIPKNLSQEERALLKQFERLRMLNLDPAFLSQPSLGFLALPPPPPSSGSTVNRAR